MKALKDIIWTAGIILACVFLPSSALAGNYDIYGSLRAQEQYIDNSQQAWEQQRYEYEQACRLDQINQRLQELQAQAIIKQRLEDLQAQELEEQLLELQDQ